MRDTGRKIISAILALWWLATLGFYMYQWAPIVKDYVAQNMYYIVWALALIFIIFFLQFGLVVLPGKRLKLKAVVMWLLVVILWYYFISNDAAAWMFAGDIISLLWVLIIYLSLAWVIVTKQAEKKEALKKQVVIEV